MTIAPIVKEMNVLQQGGHLFDYPSLWNDEKHLSANTASAYSVTTMRTNAGLKAGQPVFLVFAADGPFWANFSGNAAAIPSADITDGSGSEFSPAQRYVDATITSISFIAVAGTNVSIQVFRP